MKHEKRVVALLAHTAIRIDPLEWRENRRCLIGMTVYDSKRATLVQSATVTIGIKCVR